MCILMVLTFRDYLSMIMLKARVSLWEKVSLYKAFGRKIGWWKLWFRIIEFISMNRSRSK